MLTTITNIIVNGEGGLNNISFLIYQQYNSESSVLKSESHLNLG